MEQGEGGTCIARLKTAEDIGKAPPAKADDVGSHQSAMSRKDASAQKTQMVVYPRMPHGPREPKFQLDLMERHLAWMEKYVR